LAGLAATNTPLAAPPLHPYRWMILAGVWLLYYSFGLTIAAMAPLVKPITEELGLSHSAMGGILGAWPLVYIVAALPGGAFLDRVGIRKALFLSVLIIAASAICRSISTGHLSLFLAVGLFGLGGPLVSVGAPKAITLWFEGKERGVAMGLYITGPALGGVTALALTNSVVMPLVGGDWRAALQVYAVFVLATGVVWLFISGNALAQEVERKVAAQEKKPQFEIFVELIRMRPIQIVLVMSVGIFFYNHGLGNWLPEILRSRGMSPEAAGYWASVPTAMGVIGALIIPRLAVPERRVFLLLFLFICAGLGTQMMQNDPGLGLASGLILQGITRTTMMTIMIMVLVDTKGIEAHSVGLASGLFFSAAEIGGVLGPLTVGIVSDLTGGFTVALDMMSLICVALIGMLVLLRRTTG
jgi:cyanate permease